MNLLLIANSIHVNKTNYCWRIYHADQGVFNAKTDLILSGGVIFGQCPIKHHEVMGSIPGTSTTLKLD